MYITARYVHTQAFLHSPFYYQGPPNIYNQTVGRLQM